MKDKSSFSWILCFAAQCRGRMSASVLLAVMGAACGMIPYFAVSVLLRKIFEQNCTLGEIFSIAAISLCGYLGKVWLSALSTILSHKSAFLILKNIRISLAAKLARMPMGKITDTPSGTFKTILVDTVEKLELPLAHLIPEMTANILIPLFMFLLLFMLDFRLALVSLLTIPIGFLCYMGMMKDYQLRYGRVLRAAKNMDFAIVEYIGGIEVIKTFHQSALSYGKYVQAVRENRLAKSDWFQKTNPYYAAGVAIMPSCLLGVLPVGSWLYLQGRLSAPVFISCMILALGMVKPLMQALEYTDSLAMVDSTVREVAEILEGEELQRPKERVEIPNCRLVFSDVCFSYDEARVLREVSFSVEAGSVLAIVGASGSGKSTIARLIASFWEPSEGSITIGGVDLRKIPLEQAMEMVSYVSQDNFLFHLSIRENIRIGNPDASDQEVEDAAKRAGCHAFITTLPQGYETQTGDAGNALSGGERQRITIARAILKNSPIIVLDEATAFTDPENEALIQESINSLIQDKTLIVIAHRLGTVTGADEILLMEQGGIAARGRHGELLEKSSLYRRLWEAYQDSKDEAEVAEK